VPTDTIVIMYGVGKKHLETVAVLLEESTINLAQRKQIISNMLADKELTKCIAGCYSRISSAAEQLLESFEGPHQTRFWLQSYINAEARQVAAKQAFPTPVSYQALVCKTANCSKATNMLHANNYLLMKTKEQGLPVNVVRDTGALALDRSLNNNDRHIITKNYVEQLENTYSANNLVTYFSEKLHGNINTLFSRDLDYADKINMIQTKLNLLGKDDLYYPGEILDPEDSLKSADHFKITLTERLAKREPSSETNSLPNMGLLNKAEIHTLVSPEDGKTLEFHRYPSLALSWFKRDEERKPFLSFIKEKGLDHFMTLRQLRTYDDEDSSILVLPDFLIKNTKDLLLVVNHLPKEKSFLNWVPLRYVVSLVKKEVTPNQFVELLKNILFIPNRDQANKFLRDCGTVLVRNMLRDGILQADVDMVFPGLSVKYEAKAYNNNTKQSGLKITKELLQLLTICHFRDFKQFVFFKIDYLDYLNDISFAHVDLKNAQFFQPINHCNFNSADLRGVKFHNHLNTLSLQTDLREVTFPIANAQVTTLDLRGARLSTPSFARLRELEITDFSGTYLSEVDFQHSTIKPCLQYLNFHEANLESANLRLINLHGTQLTKANLAKANLVGATLSFDNQFDQQTNLKNSRLNLSTLYSLHQKLGIKDFERCTILIDWNNANMPNNLRFEQVDLRRSTFIGEVLRGHFVQSDFTNATFKASTSSANRQPSKLHMNVMFNTSELKKVTFNQVKFLQTTQFSDCLLTDIAFNSVEMDANLLFHFYTQGHRNFKGVNELTGHLPSKLLPFPMLDAELNQPTFINLYRLGLRDFRGSSLNGFYLGELLIKKAISDSDLKLEGARYPTFQLGCRRSRRSLDTRCTTHFLFQSRIEANLASTDKIKQTIQSSTSKTVTVEVLSLRMKSIYSLENINELNIHWGYLPRDIDYTKLISFLDGARQSSTRSTLKVQSYIYQPMTDTNPLREFVQDLEFRGFSQVKIEYVNQQKQVSLMKIEGTKLSITHSPGGSLIRLHLARLEQTKITVRPTPTIKPTLHPTAAKPIDKKNYSRLKIFMAKAKLKLSGSHRIYSREGGYYLIGESVMNALYQWYINRSPEVKEIDTKTKAALKELVYHVAEEVGRERLATTRQIELADRVANQCIDRGECSNEELVISNVVNSLYSMRPDLMIGNEYLFKKIKEGLIAIGSFITHQFDKIKQFFSRSNNKLQKRAILDWYESPLLMQLVKSIESGFSILDIGLEQDDTYSEEELVGFLSSLWQALDAQGVTNATSTESLLALLNNTAFIEQTLNLQQEKQVEVKEGDEATLDLASTAPLNLNATANSDRLPRQKRAIPFLFHSKEVAKHSGNYLGIEATATKNTHFHYLNTSNTSPGISRVTASSDTISTLFLLDTAVRYWTRNPHRSTIDESDNANKYSEKQIQNILERKFTRH
jgi:uncharacterized protein YjbI with pentapeptide repeats